MSKRQLCIGLSLSATWMKGAGWRRPDSGVEQLYSSELYVRLAQRAEQAKLDFVFKPDALLLRAAALDHSPGFGGLDPTLLMTAIARETSRIGLVTTMSTMFYPPYIAARQLQSLHWLSNGRAGWNMVTALDGADNFSATPLPASEARYAQAEEFAEVVGKLWSSFPHEALLLDRSKGKFADSSLITAIEHSGEHFSVKGPLNVPAHAAGAPPLFQAGASERGRSFAAATADAVFAAAPDRAAGTELRADLRRRARQLGRDPDAVRVLPGMHFILGRTRSEAQELYQEAHAHLGAELRYAALHSLLGLDIRGWPLDQRITGELLAASQQPAPPVRSQTHADLLHRYIHTEQPTVQELLNRPEVTASGHWMVVGTVEDAAREIGLWHEAGALDGLIALPGGSLQSLDLLLDELIPMLAEQGLFRHEYAGTTLRAHLGMA